MFTRPLRTAALAAAALVTAAAAHAQTKVPFALDWKFEGPSAAYFAAIDNGHFGDAGLDVTIEAHHQGRALGGQGGARSV